MTEIDRFELSIGCRLTEQDGVAMVGLIGRHVVDTFIVRIRNQ